MNQCLTNLKFVAYANIGFEQALDRKIFAEATVHQTIDTELPAPVSIVFNGINIYRLVGPAMMLQISLTIADQVGLPESNRTRDRLFVKTRRPWSIHRISRPGFAQQLRQSNLNGQQ